MNLTRTLDLVKRAQAGERSAFDRLIARYYERVRAIVRVRMGARVRSLCDSGDILQETFAVAVRTFDRFEMRNEGALINWLARLAERQITDAADRAIAGKRDRNRERPLEANPTTGPMDLASPAPGPTELLASREDRRLVEQCLAELAPPQRELILLRNYADMPWQEIAEETGRPSADAARMAHTAALLALAKQVKARRQTSFG